MTKVFLLTLVSLIAATHQLRGQMTADDRQVSVAPYWGGRQAALSLTFDDGLQDQFTLAAPELKKRGLRATFAIVGSKVGGIMRSSQDRKMGIDGTPCMTWDMLRQLVADGHEIGSHGWGHKNVTKLSDEALRHEVLCNDSALHAQTGQWPRSYFYPGNQKDSATVAFCEQGRVGSRLFQTSIGGKRDTLWLRRWVDGLLERGEWGVGMTHGIATGYDHFADPQVLWHLLDYVASLEGHLWVAPFAEVLAYIKERQNTRMDVCNQGRKAVVTLTTNLPADIFNYPLTLLLSSRPVAKVEQDHRKLAVYGQAGRQMVDVRLHAGPVTIYYEQIR